MALSQSLLLTGPEEGCSNEDGQQLVGSYEGTESKGSQTLGRILPSVGAFTVQCALCMKWRLIPTKEKYEEIRQYILEDPFICSRACSWRPNATCDEPSDLSQDRSQLWAIDRPNIPLAPPGWERLLVLRGAGSTKFADVYYRAPSGKRLRSMPEVERFLAEHPEYVKAGVQMSQFSFVIPRPLDQGYVRKKAMDSFPGMRGRIVDKTGASTTQLKRPSFKPSTSKERSEKLFAHKKSLAQILAGGQSWRSSGASVNRGRFVSGDSALATQAVEGVLSVNESSFQGYQEQRDLLVMEGTVHTGEAIQPVGRNENSSQAYLHLECSKEHAAEGGNFIDNQTGGRSWNLTDVQPSNTSRNPSTVLVGFENKCTDLQVLPESNAHSISLKDGFPLVIDVDGIYGTSKDPTIQDREVGTEFKLHSPTDGSS